MDRKSHRLIVSTQKITNRNHSEDRRISHNILEVCEDKNHSKINRCHLQVGKCHGCRWKQTSAKTLKIISKKTMHMIWCHSKLKTKCVLVIQTIDMLCSIHVYGINLCKSRNWTWPEPKQHNESFHQLRLFIKIHDIKLAILAIN